MGDKQSTDHEDNPEPKVPKGTIKVDQLNQLPDDLIKRIGTEWLKPHDVLRVQKEARMHLHRRQQAGTPRLQLFDPIIEDIAPGYAVLTGHPKKLLHYLAKDPTLFFKPCHHIIGPANQQYNDVSPADLISFLGDYEMQNQVREWVSQLPEEIREDFSKQWEEHQASKGRGGADFVMVMGNHPPDFSTVCEATDVFDDITIKRKLLINPNGIVCWQAPDKQFHWYYADSNKKTLNEIELSKPGQHEPEYAMLCAKMEKTLTARRLSNKEHQFFETHAKIQVDNQKQSIKIHREGIRYRQQDGTEYQDTQYDMNRVLNAYLECIRLFRAANCERLYDDADRVFRTKVGYEQCGMPLHFLQRLCEEGRSFYPLADDYTKTPFVRSFKIYSRSIGSQNTKLAFDVKSGQFSGDLGSTDADSSCAIYRDTEKKGGMMGGINCNGGYGLNTLLIDLPALNRFVIDAYNCVNDFKPSVHPVTDESRPHY